MRQHVWLPSLLPHRFANTGKRFRQIDARVDSIQNCRHGVFIRCRFPVRVKEIDARSCGNVMSGRSNEDGGNWDSGMAAMTGKPIRERIGSTCSESIAQQLDRCCGLFDQRLADQVALRYSANVVP